MMQVTDMPSRVLNTIKSRFWIASVVNYFDADFARIGAERAEPDKFRLAATVSNENIGARLEETMAPSDGGD